VSFTLVSFHAHPDDEALLTAGTLARLAAEGHRIVLVVATAGEAGLTSTRLIAGRGLASERLAELNRSADALGCARVVCLGYADSGMPDAPSGSPDAFANVDVELAARRLAEVLEEEEADALTIYDPAGGYGHFDHIQVHRVGTRAAELAATPLVLQASVDRDALLRVLRALNRLARLGAIISRRPLPADFAPSRFLAAYTPAAQLTHRVDVRHYVRQKRAAMQAHATQAAADSGDRTLAFCLRLPPPLFRLAFGREWFVEVGRSPTRPLLDDLFASLRKHGQSGLDPR
jgi:LmbE family N-acetylglucosaminyl deacetylase